MYKGIYGLSMLIALLTAADAFASPWELLFSLGAAQYKMGSSTYQITTTETDNVRQTDNPWVGTINIGFNYRVPPIFLPELWLGLNYRHSSHNLFAHYTRGQIAQYQEPELENYTYSLTATNDRVALDLMLPIACTPNTSLAPIGGIAYGRTGLKYSDRPNAGVSLGNLILAPHYKYSLIPEVGLGFFYQYSTNIKLSLQYLYTWLGDMDTSKTGWLTGVQSDLIAPAHFALNNNAVLVGLSFSL